MKARKAAVIFIFVTVTLDMLALGLIAPVLPKLVLNFLGGDASSAAKWFGVFGTVFALMQFVFSPVLGVLSDRFGRRPIILASNLGLGLDYVVMAVAPSIGWLFLGRIISGITAASISTSMAYISDVVEPEKRASAFGMIGAAFGVGFILGPALGGLLGTSDPRLPFWVAGGLSLTNAIYGYFFVPESLPPERRKPFTLVRANPVGALVLLRSHPELFQLSVIQFIGYVAHEVFNIWALYAIFRYAWNEGMVGLSLALVGVCSVIISVALVGPIVKKLGERVTLYLGQFLGGLGMVLAGLARTGTGFLLSVPVMMLWSISGPAAQGMMTRRVSESEQGELQGAINSLRSVAVIIGPGLFTFTFAYFIDQKHVRPMPGATWYLGGALLFFATLLSLRIPKLPRAEAIPAQLAATEGRSFLLPRRRKVRARWQVCFSFRVFAELPETLSLEEVHAASCAARKICPGQTARDDGLTTRPPRRCARLRGIAPDSVWPNE
ncbi:MAG: TCR/Tet family MFS transporter [Chthoniobacterales bacterium]|nr:TCR/Tet family MFS transporter [Chthoniobacterales bacterium]